METNTGFFRRYRIVINWPMQLKYALLTVALVSLACFTVWWETYRALTGLVNDGLVTNVVLSDVLKTINIAILVKVVLLLLLVGLFSLGISHFVAGPLYRFERSLQTIADGDLTHQIRLRKRDSFQRTGEIFNRTTMHLESKVRADQEKARSLSAEIDRLAMSTDEDTASKLRQISSQLLALLSSFKVADDKTDGPHP